MLEMDAYDEPDPDSDLDYEESYTKRSKRRKNSGRVSQTNLPQFSKFHFSNVRDVAVVLTRLVHLVAGKEAVEEEKKLLRITSNQHQETPINPSLVSVSFNIFVLFQVLVCNTNVAKI